MTILPAVLDIEIIQGATNDNVFQFTDASNAPIDLTGKNARMQFRENIFSDTPFLTLTTENGGITLGGTNGTLAWTISATASAALTAQIGVWDLEIITGSGAGSRVDRYLGGKVFLSPEVTR
jgi:hypothetical protein